MTEGDITALARKLGLSCRRRGVTVATAESCTGGGVAEAITRIAGSSAWFDRGFVTYQDLAKEQMLGVKQHTLEQHGAVSGEVAREMALGALRHSQAAVSVAITGIAGPGGAVPGKPVGTVWLAWAAPKAGVQVRAFHLKGGRAEVRIQSVSIAIQGLIDLLS
ncbi:MAG: CinA family protein [Usitatibacter sp.]